MDARKLIDKSSFDPTQKKSLVLALEAAWLIVVLQMDIPVPTAQVRIALAKAVLRNAEKCGFDVDAIVKEFRGRDSSRALASRHSCQKPTTHSCVA